MSEDLTEQEKAISEFYGHKYHIKVKKQQRNCVLFQLISTQPILFEFVIAYPVMSWFSFQNSFSNSDTAFELCEKFANIEEVIKHNFEWSINDLYRNAIVIGLSYYIYIFDTDLFITNKDCLIDKFSGSSVTVYDILDHPALQQFRINHSKPVNRIIVD